MKKFLKRSIIFSIPLIIYLIISILIDPFNVLYKSDHKVLNELKLKTSSKINYPLFKLQKFENHPVDIILLGDSRMDKLKDNIIDELAQVKSANLAYAGGTLEEMIITFWHIVKKHAIKKVVLGINFELYNTKNNFDRVTNAIELKESPLKYLFSEYSYKSIYYILKSLFTGNHVDIEKPKLSREKFWKLQLEQSAKSHYEYYNYPEKYFNQLYDISSYCKKENIELIIIIPPTHVDLQKRISDFGLKNEEKRFKRDIYKLAQAYDYNYPNSITLDKNNFLDPYHFNDSIAKILIEEIFLKKIKYAKFSP